MEKKATKKKVARKGSAKVTHVNAAKVSLEVVKSALALKKNATVASFNNRAKELCVTATGSLRILVKRRVKLNTTAVKAAITKYNGM